MGKTAEAIIEATKEATADASSVVKLFKEAVARMDKGEEPEATEATTTRVVIVDSLAEEQPVQGELPFNGPTEAVGAEVAVAAPNPSVTPEPAPAVTVEASTPTDGTTDDTRAPLDLTVKAKELKQPRKPIINWNQVGDQLKQGWGIFTRGVSLIVTSFVDWLFTFIAGLWFVITRSIPAVCYIVGWIARGIYNSFMQGWNQVPLITEGKLTDPQPPKTPGALALVA